MVNAKSNYQEQLERAAWDRAAWISFWIPKFSKTAPRRFVDYNPLRKDSGKNLIETLDAMAKARKILPKKISEQELKRKFDKWLIENEDY
jgi:hypothetical protein